MTLAVRILAAMLAALAGGLLGGLIGRSTRHEPPPSELAPSPPVSRRRAIVPGGASMAGAMPEVPDVQEVHPACDSRDGHPLVLDIERLELLPLDETEPAAGFPCRPDPALPPTLGKAARRLLEADLETLGTLELVERLGISLQGRTVAALPAQTPHGVPMAPSDAGEVLRAARDTLHRISGAA